MTEQDPEQKIQGQIASLVQAEAQADKQPIAKEELHVLQAAAGRLDMLLAETAQADRQLLRAAAARLDQLLTDLEAGRDPGHAIKRSRKKEIEHD